jgi:hypothetical protein
MAVVHVGGVGSRREARSDKQAGAASSDARGSSDARRSSNARGWCSELGNGLRKIKI